METLTFTTRLARYSMIRSKFVASLRVATPHAQIRSLSSSSLLFNKQNVAEKDGKKLSSQEAKVEAARLALQSLKDMGSLFSSGNEDAMQPIDTAPIFEHPELFTDLNVLHQGQVVQELQLKFEDKWTKLTPQDKKLAYYIYYGNWGPREKFTNWNEASAPLDLPFTVPTVIRNATPRAKDVINKLEPVILSETEVRKEQFDTKKMDPVTKTFIYVAIFITMFALARDKKIGEEGKPSEPFLHDPYKKKKEEEEIAKKALEEAEALKNKRHWYYLWLK